MALAHQLLAAFSSHSSVCSGVTTGFFLAFLTSTLESTSCTTTCPCRCPCPVSHVAAQTLSFFPCKPSRLSPLRIGRGDPLRAAILGTFLLRSWLPRGRQGCRVLGCYGGLRFPVFRYFNSPCAAAYIRVLAELLRPRRDVISSPCLRRRKSQRPRCRFPRLAAISCLPLESR